jgi:hypothetical protein
VRIGPPTEAAFLLEFDSRHVCEYCCHAISEGLALFGARILAIILAEKADASKAAAVAENKLTNDFSVFVFDCATSTCLAAKINFGTLKRTAVLPKSELERANSKLGHGPRAAFAWPATLPPANAMLHRI